MRKYKVQLGIDGYTLKTVIIEARNRQEAFSKVHSGRHITPDMGYNFISITPIKKGDK